MTDGDSVTQWLENLKTGDEVAAQLLWDRYFGQLAAVAGKRMRKFDRLPADGEDVALSALHSLCQGVNEGIFPELSNRDSLWKLLVAITVRKANRVVRDELRQKRGGGRTVGESDLSLARDQESGLGGLEMVLGREPSPDFVLQLEDELEHLFRLLPDEELKRIALGKLQGLTSAEIAGQIGKALATVERRLKLIRSCWAESVTV